MWRACDRAFSNDRVYPVAVADSTNSKGTHLQNTYTAPHRSLGWLPRIAHSSLGGPFASIVHHHALVGLAFRIGAETFTKPTQQGDRLENAR